MALNDVDFNALCDAFVSMRTRKEMAFFLKDLCTPQELFALCERLKVCELLHQGHSYRKVRDISGASLTTIGRVARFLKEEPYHGYRRFLEKKGE